MHKNISNYQATRKKVVTATTHCSQVKWSEKNKQTTTIYKRKQSQHKLENRLTTRQMQSVCERLYIYNLTIVDDWTNAMQKLGFCTLHKHNSCIQIFICMGIFSNSITKGTCIRWLQNVFHRSMWSSMKKIHQNLLNSFEMFEMPLCRMSHHVKGIWKIFRVMFYCAAIHRTNSRQCYCKYHRRNMSLVYITFARCRSWILSVPLAFIASIKNLVNHFSSTSICAW